MVFNTLVINSLTTKNNYDTLRKTKTDTKDLSFGILRKK